MHAVTRKPSIAVGFAVLSLVAVGCGAFPGQGDGGEEKPSLVGTWSSSDGTPEKTFGEADLGNCSGFFYNRGRPLDTGGPMTCQLSADPDAAGRYRLLVTQTGNRATYLVEFAGSNRADVYTKDGTLLYSLTRF